MRVVALLITLALLGGCDDDAERRRAIAAADDAELFRLTDPAHGADELRNRILRNLKLSSPYIAVWIDGDARVIPTSTPWTVRCDRYNGLSIAFTTSMTNLGGGFGIKLSDAPPNKAQCLDIAMS